MALAHAGVLILLRAHGRSEIVVAGEFRKSRQSRMLCHARRILSRGHPRGLLASIDCGAGKPSADHLRFCFHLVNSSLKSSHESWRYSRSLFSIASTVTS